MAFTPASRFPLVLLVLLGAMLVWFKPSFNGDVIEYSLTTIAVADHGTPDIRLQNIARAKAALPHFTPPFEILERDMRAGIKDVYPAFARGREGKVYAVHFFGYPALVALPYTVFERIGIDPMKGYLVINLLALLVLGLSLKRFFQSDLKAWCALLLFMLCGGDQYWRWITPECMSAAALLSGMLLFCSGAPLRGALLAGLAAQQNPTILAFFGFVPLLTLALDYDRTARLRANVLRALPPRTIAALGAGLAVFSLPLLFNLYHFGVPSLIAQRFSNPDFIGLTRLLSFFFDLNQGMLVAIPGVLLALVCWGWRQPRRDALILALCLAFTLTLVVPAFTVINWNSDAAGVMRYAFWSSMPIVFALLWRLRRSERVPLVMLALVLAFQGLCAWSARSYSYIEFSPLARAVLRHAPGLYHPEPEIFAERLEHHDSYFWPNQVYMYQADGVPVKTLYHLKHPDIDLRLCGPEARLAPDNQFHDSYRGWRYIDGAPRCIAPPGPATFELAQFRSSGRIRLASGWSSPESGEWNGAWSNAACSRITLKLAPGARPGSLTILGTYFGANTRTRVRVNGADLGWHALNQESKIALPAAAMAPESMEIELEHEAPAAPGGADTRLLALFLRRVRIE
ncbi:MAG: hypothetical protein V4723_16245 [Pseudomonadota bacterium]